MGHTGAENNERYKPVYNKRYTHLKLIRIWREWELAQNQTQSTGRRELGEEWRNICLWKLSQRTCRNEEKRLFAELAELGRFLEFGAVVFDNKPTIQDMPWAHEDSQN